MKTDIYATTLKENELDLLISKKISERNNWDIELLRQINSIVDPIYTANIIREPNNNVNAEIDQVKNTNPKYSRDLDHFNTLEFDKFSSPLFLTHDSRVPRSYLKDQGGLNTSSSSYNIVKETQSYASLLQSQLPPSIPRPISSIKNNASIPRPTTSAKQREKLDENTTPTRIHRMMRPGTVELHQSSLKYEDNDNDSLSNFGWNITQDIDDTDNFSEKSEERIERDIIRTSRNSSRSSSAKSSTGYTTATTPHFFPKQVTDLGGLGPDKSNDSYLLKVLLI
jgi:hypothetical protein